MNTNNSLYLTLAPGTKIYQYSDGSYLPDAQQPKPNNQSTYNCHTATRYKSVVIGKNGIAKSYDPHKGCLVDTDKHLPELYKSREGCCGCSACYSICPVRNYLPDQGIESVGKNNEVYALPHGAIYMEEDEEGFQYPVVDAGLCMRCYQCIKVCPLK